MNKKNTDNLYRFFVTFSILICVFILPYISAVRSKLVDGDVGGNPANEYIVLEKADQIAAYIWPVLIVYFIAFVYLIVKKTYGRKVYYPLALFTFYILANNLAVTYLGSSAAWYFIGLLFFLIMVLIISSIIGKKLDDNIIDKKMLVILAGVFFLIVGNYLSGILLQNFFNLGDATTEMQPTYANVNEMAAEVKREIEELLDHEVIVVNSLQVDAELNKITGIELLIETKNAPADVSDFCHRIIGVYKDLRVVLDKYHYTNQSVRFTFTDRNPYAEPSSVHYQKDGYITDEGESYFIYLNPAPIIIEK